MNKPKWKWIKVTKQYVGTELANPDYVLWLEEQLSIARNRESANSGEASTGKNAIDALAEISRNYTEAQASWEFYNWYGNNRLRLNAVLAQKI